MTDGTTDEILLLNEDGCAQDKFLLGNVEYAGDLWARKESHVFKYADRANLYFSCQMRVTIKEPGQECVVSVPIGNEQMICFGTCQSESPRSSRCLNAHRSHVRSVRRHSDPMQDSWPTCLCQSRSWWQTST